MNYLKPFNFLGYQFDAYALEKIEIAILWIVGYLIMHIGMEIYIYIQRKRGKEVKFDY